MDQDFDLEALIAERDDPISSSTEVVLLPSQQRHLELISHLAAYSELLIAVIGIDGSGKTTLAHSLIEQRQTPEETLFFNASPTFGIPALLQTIASQWQLTELAQNRASALDQLTQLGSARYADGGQLLVVIDRAEQLDTDTLNDIAHLALMMPQYLSFALFGRTGFELSLRSSPAHAPLHALYLEPLSGQESEQLARQLLGSSLTTAQVHSAHKDSHGWVGALIAQLEDRQQLAATKISNNDNANRSANTTAAPANIQKAPFPLTHILGSAALVAVLLLAFLYQRGDDSSLDTVAEITLSDDALATVEREQALRSLLERAEPEDFNFSDALDSDVERSVILDDSSATNDARVAAPSAPIAAVQHTAAVAEPAAARQLPAAPAAPVAKEAATIKLPYDGSALLTQRSGYIVQLLGVRDVAAALQYRERWQTAIGQRLYLYQTTHQEQPWFVVVAGVYDNEATARRAVQQYPARIKANSPWVRPIAAVHDALK